MKTFEALNDAYENREWTVVSDQGNPQLDPLRDGPRFKERLMRDGFSN
jgi:hypothetical protein